MSYKSHYDLVLFGSGSLARALLIALADRARVPLRILLVARNKSRLTKLKGLTLARANCFEQPIEIITKTSSYATTEIDGLFESIDARIVLVAVSMQSPWSMSPKWRALVQICGYGITLPLQVVLAKRIFAGALAAMPQAFRINACYPDLVNCVLEKIGIPVHAGLGNVAILAAFLNAAHKHARISVAAHHSHIAGIIDGSWKDQPRPLIWDGDERIQADVLDEWISSISLPADGSLNLVTAASVVPMLLALLGHQDRWAGHAPGVDGKIGGYPVNVDDAGISLRIPPGTSVDEMEVLNLRSCMPDGARVTPMGYFGVPDETMNRAYELGVKLPALLLNWHAQDVDKIAAELDTLRSHLETMT